MSFTRRDALVGMSAGSALLSGSQAIASATAVGRQPDAMERIGLEIAPRERLSMDFDWRFHLGDAQDLNKDFQFGANQRTYAKQGVGVGSATAADFTDIAWGKTNFDDRDWEAVNLPHDWATALPFTPNAAFKAVNAKSEDPRNGHGFKPLGREYPMTSVGWYRKRFALPSSDAGKRLSIEFDGVFRDCLVIFNGYVLARNESGYAPFRVDITDVANIGGENLLTLRVDATLGEGWFYEGAGAYRHVWMVKTAPVHVPQWGVLVRSRTNGAVEVVCDVANEADEPATVVVNSMIYSASGQPVARGRSEPVALEPWSVGAVPQAFRIDGPVLWDVDHPHQYTLVSEIETNGVVDRFVTRFGIRDIRFDPADGFFLNGRALKLRGANDHQDHAGVGTAIPDWLHRFRMERLKAMGVNAVRTAHNPATPEMLDACDDMGVMVLAEARLMSSSPEAMSQLERLVKRDRNRPGVILWSIGNEEPQEASVRGARVARTMKRLVRRLDPTRLVGAALDNSWTKPQGISPVLDFIGVNYNANLYGDIHAAFPDKIIIGTETGSSVSTRGTYLRDESRRHLPAYDTVAPPWGALLHDWLPGVETTPYIAGGFVWTGFDYRGEPTPYYTWPSIGSQFGMMDSCGFAKDNFYYLQSWWRPEPVLHLLPHWNWAGREGQDIDVWCYSNLEAVELIVNGRSLGVQAIKRFGHAEWKVVYQPGEIVALGYRGGRVVLRDSRQTAGPVAAVQLAPDRSRLNADGRDLAVVTVAVIDGQGRLAPTSSDLISFEVQGPGKIIGVGNGDPTSHEPDKASSRSVFNGQCQVLVQSILGRPGPIRVKATAQGLKAGECVLLAERGRLPAIV